MLAKAGEGDRVIRTKMVRVFCLLHSYLVFLILHPTLSLPSQNIYSLANAKAERHKEDDACFILFFIIFSNLVAKKPLDAYFP